MTIEAGARYDKAICVRLPSRVIDELARVSAERSVKPMDAVRAMVMALIRDPNAFPDIGLPTHAPKSTA
ncbi:hypothetical protein KDX26_19410 [Burkholderia cenocepacia]|uniref:hypothetical protein n=1 Tax=Burkholderia cenocepacia TaxID=95486 RepID=UPI001B8E7368|nr:hypothetical protein [Burkholderia cenocepacia]MBR8384568.1 hypothetical protein [Burkholderia cenocepacia]